MVTRLGEVRTGLVADGVITRAQAEAVEQAITEAGLFRFGHFHGRGMHLDLVAQTIGSRSTTC